MICFSKLRDQLYLVFRFSDEFLIGNKLRDLKYLIPPEIGFLLWVLGRPISLRILGRSTSLTNVLWQFRRSSTLVGLRSPLEGSSCRPNPARRPRPTGHAALSCAILRFGPSFLDYFTFRPLCWCETCASLPCRVCVSLRGAHGGFGEAEVAAGRRPHRAAGTGMDGGSCLRVGLRCELPSCRRALAAFIRSFVSFSRCSASRSPLPLLCEVCTVGRV